MDILTNLTIRIHTAVKHRLFLPIPGLYEKEENLNHIVSDLFKDYLNKGYEANRLNLEIQQALNTLKNKGYIRIQKKYCS